MKTRRNRRPFSRPTRSSADNGRFSSSPVLQPLEPRKLLTTLYASPDLDMGQTNSFYGWVAMPTWVTDQTLDASSVEDRSVRLGIRLLDSNPNSQARVTILDLRGNPLFPWMGIGTDGTEQTDITVATEVGEDGLWGSDDDETEDVFALDSGYLPGWRVAVDTMGNFVPGTWIADGAFHPVRQLDWDEDGMPPAWDTDNVPGNFDIVIPATGYWHPGMDGFYETEDDARLPGAFMFPGAGTDDRIIGTADDDWVGDVASDPWLPPDTMDFEPHLVDRRIAGTLADDGIADFNNGIGRIILSGTTATTRLAFFIIDDFTSPEFNPNNPQANDPFEEPESSHIGIAVDSQGNVYQAPAMGSIVIGNPTHADWSIANIMGNLFPLGFQLYDRTTEGIFFDDPSLNETVGRIAIDGALYGTSVFPGALDTLHVGYFGGNLIVDGDFDSFIVAGDSSYFTLDGQDFDTRGFVRVGRVMGSYIVGGVMSTQLTVEGDFDPDAIEDKPFLRADKTVFEQERDLFPPGDEDHYQRTFAAGNLAYILGEDGDQVEYLVNDSRGSAQFIGREVGYTAVSGVLGTEPGDDPHEIGDGGDDVDYYAIAVRAGQEIEVSLSAQTLITLQDVEGTILQSRGADGTLGVIRYTPNESGVIYIVIENTAGFSGTGTAYQLIVSGAAATTLGEVRAMGRLQYSQFDGSAIITDFGDIGTVRVGLDAADDEDHPFIGNLLISAGGNLWNVTSGGSIGVADNDNTYSSHPLEIAAGQHIGQVLAGFGQDPDGGADGFHGGSIGAARINAGGDIGVVWAQAAGGIVGGGNELTNVYGDIGGISRDGAALSVVLTEIFAAGNIGMIRADTRILADPDPSVGLSVRVGQGGVIDLIEAGARGQQSHDLGVAPIVGGVTGGQILLSTGLGGNVRFFRAPHVWANGVEGAVLPLSNGEQMTIVDDSGAIFTVRVIGGTGSIHTHAVDSSIGVATVRIEANLTNGGRLQITNNSGHVEIGDVVVTGGGNTGQIIFDGRERTDVYMVRAIGGINRIENRTSGDIVAIDTDGVNRVRIGGNLGRTYTSTAIGPQNLLGPRLGFGTGGEVGAGFFYTTGTFGSGGDSELAGAPFDPWLNGLAIREGGTVTNNGGRIDVDGTIVDIIAEPSLGRVTANADRSTPFGEFHGVEGSIYSEGNITRLQLGDGLVDTGAGPFITGVVAAAGQVIRVDIDGEGHDILGRISGFGFGGAIDGIGRINATKGASIIGADITTTHLDTHFTHPDDDAGDSGGGPVADINRIFVRDGDIVDSRIIGLDVNRVEIRNGIWDSNRLRADGEINFVRAEEYVYNYASVGGVNLITSVGNINRIETWGRRGDIRDLTVDTIANLRKLAGLNLIGLDIDVDEEISRVDAKGAIMRSLFTAGAVTNFNAQDDVERVNVNVAGPVKTFRSRQGSIIRLVLVVDGPDGRLDRLDARHDVTGEISVSGAVKFIKTREGDINARILTFSGDGDVNQIIAGRDAILDLDIDGDLRTLRAGRNLSASGTGTMLVRNDLRTVDVRNGMYMGSIIVEGSASGSIKLGSFMDGSKIAARGRISNLSVDSGVTGSIISYADGIGRLDIDGAVNGTIEARNAELENVMIRGDFAGLLNGDEGIRSLNILGNASGRITSGASIDRLDIDGNATSLNILALHDIRNADIGGSVTSSVIAAGELLDRVDVAGNATSSFFLAGLESLGGDNAVGGLGDNLDIWSSGEIDDINIGGGITNVTFAAGVRAGADGSYATLDANTDLAPGLSNIDSITVDGAASGTNYVVADTTIGTVFVDGVQRTINGGGDVFLIELDQAPLTLVGSTAFSDGTPATFTDSDGDTITLSIRGSGTGLYTLSGGGSGNLTGLVFNGTTAQSTVELRVTTVGGNGLVDLNNVHIQFADDAEVNSFLLQGHLDGTDALTIDGSANSITVENATTTGTVAVGGEASRISTNVVGATVFDITQVGNFDVQDGNFGGRINSQSINSLNVRNGEVRGVVFGRDSIGNITSNNMVGAKISSRGDINSITADTISNLTWISAGDRIVRVTLNGDMIDSEIMAGMSLGSDGVYGGAFSATDRLTAGVVENVNIRGSMIRSSIAAGVDRGEDAYFGTEDDLGALGLSHIRTVQVSGSIQGSNFNSQNYAVTAAGPVENFRVGGNEFFRQGNMERDRVEVTPIPLVVQSVRTRIDVETFFIDIVFNEDVDVSTILLEPGNPQAESAISFENPIDPMGIVPSSNDDYTIRYYADERRVEIEFFRSFTVPNGGIYTLVIDGEAIRSTSNINLDANQDGVTGDSYEQNFMLGDAGDRTVDGTWDPDGDPNTMNTVEFEEASSLDLLLDDLVGGEGTKNRALSFLGVIGDHPNEDSFFFPPKFDVDIYSVTLEAGDIFRGFLTLVSGSPFVGSASLRDSTGGIVATEATISSGYVVTGTGTYYLTVAGTRLGPAGPPGVDELIDISNATGMFTPPIPVLPILPDQVSNDVGRYQLNVNIFSDGDTGFILGTDLDLVDGEALITEGFIGYDVNGAPVNSFSDADVYDISNVLLSDNTTTTQLEEGMTITVTLRLSEVGGNMGGAYEVGIFQTTQTVGIVDGLLMGAPGPFVGDTTQFASTTTDITISFQIPEAGTYAVMVQGSIQTNYELIVTVDTSTQGDRYAQPREQNVLLETRGGFADWFGITGTDIPAMDLSFIGFGGLEAPVLSRVIDQVETFYGDAGVTVNVSTNPADFAGEEFTTIFLSNYNDGPNSWGIASSLDPQNQNESNEAIVFIPGFAQFVAPGQVDDLGDMLARVVAHELGHTLGLRHAVNPNPMGPITIMNPGNVPPPAPRQFVGDPDDPWGTAQVLSGAEWFFGLQNETDLLQLIFDVDT